VKIREEGRIGAEKIFNYIKRFDRGDTLKAMRKALGILKKRSRYVRGMNIIMVNDEGIYVSSFFSEDEAYFTMHYREGADALTICSEPYPSESGWVSISNDSLRAW
jgi:glutamine amidotransferase